MKYLNLLLLLSIITSARAFSKESLSGYLYNTKSFDGSETSLFYDDKMDSYTFSVRGKKYEYPRFRYKDIKRRHLYDVDTGDWDKLIETLSKHANTQKMNKQTPEEILSAGLKSKDVALKLVEPTSVPCNQYQGAPGSQSIMFKQDEETKIANEKAIIRAKNADDGFVLMGELTGMSLNMTSCNDNPLHGLLGDSGLGLTSHGNGIEGDDRGKSFCIGSSVKLDFDKGSVALRKFSDGYGRKSAVAGNSYEYMGKTYTSYYQVSEDGKVYQEFLSIDGIELEIKRDINYKESYVKVIGRKKTLDDESGLAKSIQDQWHEQTKKISGDTQVLYHYKDWMEKKSGVELYLEIGNEYEIYSDSDVEITSTPYLGANVSSLGDEHSYYTAGADIRAVFKRDKVEGEDAKFPSWSTRAYLQTKKYGDKESGTITGAEITKYFKTGDNSAAYIQMAMEYDNDRFNREFGQEEIERNGNLDFNHKLNLGWEYKW